MKKPNKTENSKEISLLDAISQNMTNLWDMPSHIPGKTMRQACRDMKPMTIEEYAELDKWEDDHE